MKNLLSKLPKIFTNDGCALLHIIVSVFISCSLANLLFWSIGQHILGGQLWCILIGGSICFVLGFIKELHDKKTTGFSRPDLKADAWGCAISVILNLVIFNFGYGV